MNRMDSIKYEKQKVLWKKLDKEIGHNYWKRYVASAFWSQISTPINLTITFLTAISTAQAQNDSIISHDMFAKLTIVSLVITTLNTFFRPHTQYASNKENMNKWREIGIRFEKEYFNRLEDKSDVSFDQKIVAYTKLQEDVDALRTSEGSELVNFLTDFLYFIAHKTCLRRYKRWLDLDRIIIDEVKVEIVQEKLQEEKDKSEYRIKIAKLEKEEQKKLQEIK
jgi:hypothetical protein